jgi:hypothetical protein
MNIKYFAICECCNFKALSKTKWEIHLKSQKHLRNGKSKIENYVCEICGYWCMHIFNLNAHRIVRHGLYEQKKQAKLYCECCNKAFYAKLFYDIHFDSKNHKKMLQREQLIKNNVFTDIDDTLIEKNYMVYLDDIKTKIETSFVITKKYNYKIIQNNT